MTRDNSANYTLWDEFLSEWSIDRVERMTLSEYTSAGAKDTFTYWVESKLDQMGSIWGGSAFKFGIYSRHEKEERGEDGNRLYTSNYAWHKKYGDTPEEAFETVKEEIIRTIRSAMQGDFEEIDRVDLGHAYKWKIAFHYQNRDNPTILPVFKLEMLLAVLKSKKKIPVSQIYRTLSLRRPKDRDILSYGKELWKEYTEMPRIWKISHGQSDFTIEERKQLRGDNTVTVAKSTKKGQGEAFAEEMNPGDYFFLCHGNDEGIVLFGRITSEAIQSEKDEEWLERSYEVIKELDSPRRYSGVKKGWTPNYNSTVMKVKPSDLALFEELILKPYFDMELTNINNKFLPSSGFISSSDISEFEAMGPNIIYYGPPGTGKTFRLIEESKKYFTDDDSALQSQAEKAMIIAESNEISWWKAIALALLDLGRPSPIEQIQEHPILKARAQLFGIKQPKNQLLHYLLSHVQIDCPNVRNSNNLAPHVFWKDEHSLWSVQRNLVESESPTLLDFLVNYQDTRATFDSRRYVFTTFHQSLSYEDFVEGIKPKMDESAESGLTYQIEPGIFKRIALRAKSNPEKKYAIFIDEINRGNIASIFGELITLIEKDKREGGENEVVVTLPYSKESFTVPENLFIVGTMNTADRSIVALDSALRRRFKFIACSPDPSLIEQPSDLTVDLQELLTVINQRITMILDKDHCIGHSYFMGIKDEPNSLEALRAVFSKAIIPLLEEYFSGDLERVGMILGDHFVHLSEDLNGEVSLATGNWDHPLETKGVYSLADIDTLGEKDFESIYENT